MGVGGQRVNTDKLLVLILLFMDHVMMEAHSPAPQRLKREAGPNMGPNTFTAHSSATRSLFCLFNIIFNTV